MRLWSRFAPVSCDEAAPDWIIIRRLDGYSCGGHQPDRDVLSRRAIQTVAAGLRRNNHDRCNRTQAHDKRIVILQDLALIV